MRLTEFGAIVIAQSTGITLSGVVHFIHYRFVKRLLHKYHAISSGTTLDKPL